MKPTEFAELFALMRGLWPKDVQRETFEAYRLLLEDVDPTAARKAILRLAATSEWLPTVAAIRSAVAEHALGLPDPESILDEVYQAIRERGWPRPPARGDLSPLAMAVIDTIGWQNLCASENPEADRAHILRIVATYRRRALEAGAIPASAGGRATPCPPLDRHAPPQALADVVSGVLKALPRPHDGESTREPASASSRIGGPP